MNNQHPYGYDVSGFTHSDHLGSASWITYSGGYPVQYIHYAPYGELMANQKTSSFDERYKFTGKERDVESGHDFYGAENHRDRTNDTLNQKTNP